MFVLLSREKVDVTVSFGLTTVTEKDDIESLFMRADNAMYKAKNAGRNRVEIL
ncbi:diguanylate cyclase [Legionella pneumophila serogroup 1]